MAWQKGQSGNPKGRAVEKPWTDAMRHTLAQFELKDADGKVKVKRGEALRKIAETMVTQAIVGDKDARRDIADRLEGRPAQAITGVDGGPVEILGVPWVSDRSR